MSTRTRFPACMARLVSLGCLALVVCAWPAWCVSANQLSEVEVKAAMLYNFIKFVEWPSNVFARPNDPIIIGVSGGEAFAAAITSTVNGRTAQGRPLHVKPVSSPAEMQACHVLFVGEGGQKPAAALEAVRTAPVLTVSDLSGFVRKGGMIGFLIVDGKTAFDINLKPTVDAKVTISSKLLRLAYSVAKAD